MAKDFLLEIHCEEIPAKFLAPLHSDLQEKLLNLLEVNGLVIQGGHLRSPDWYSPRKMRFSCRGFWKSNPISNR